MNSIRWKLIITSLIIVIMPMYMLNRYAIKNFDRFTSQSQESEMLNTAALIGELLRENWVSLSASSSDHSGFLEAYARKTDSIIQLLDTSALVICDYGNSDESSDGTDLSAAEDVKKALASQGHGTTWTITPNRKYVLYKITYPVKVEGRKIGYVRIIKSTSQITQNILKMVRDQRMALWLAIIAALIMSAIIAQTMTSRLRRLRSAAVDFIRGGKPAKLEIGGKDEIAELAVSIESMQNTIESRSKYNRDFVSTVMHELKMPLTAIKGAAELLSEGAAEKKEARDRFISNIRHESDRMVKLVWELRELTRLDTEALTGQKEAVEYTAFVKEAVSRITDTLEREHAEVKVEVPDEKISLLMMPGRIEQVLANLIDNAVRYTPVTGSILIAVERNKDGRIVTSVRDTGRGIAQSNIGKVFDRFFTTEPKDKPKDYGSGLGLAIASSIITNHGGRIWVESTEGQGAAFSFTLPGE